MGEAGRVKERGGGEPGGEGLEGGEEGGGGGWGEVGEGFVCWWVFAGYVNFEEAGFF
jgi:hypothetical protein